MPNRTINRAWVMGGLALLMLLPVTLPVPVLKKLVLDRFAVGELATSFFMSINMIGALVTAPLSGAIADVLGKRKQLVVLALVADGLLLWLLSLPVSFPVFMTIRFFEGAAHILALSVLLAIAAESAAPERRGRVMGVVGAGLTLGVAMGVPLGDVIGRGDPLRTLWAGSALVLVAAAVAAWVLREPPRREAAPTFRDVLRLLRRERMLLVPLAYAFVDRFTVGFFTTTFSLYVSRVHGPQHRIGFLLALFLLPFALLSYPFGRLSERVSRTALVAGGSILYGLGAMTLGWWPAEALPFLMLYLGVTAAVMFVPSLVMTTDLVAPSIKATAIGGFNAAGSLGFMIGPIVGGWVTELVGASHGMHAGYRAAFVTAGASELLCVLITLPFLVRLVRSGRTT